VEVSPEEGRVGPGELVRVVGVREGERAQALERLQREPGLGRVGNSRSERSRQLAAHGCRFVINVWGVG
jgi:hypothetical protein